MIGIVAPTPTSVIRTIPSPENRSAPAPITIAPPGIIPTPREIPTSTVPPTIVIPGIICVRPVAPTGKRESPSVIVHVPCVSVTDIPIIGTADYDPGGRMETNNHLGAAVVVHTFDIGIRIHGIRGFDYGLCASATVIFVHITAGLHWGIDNVGFFYLRFNPLIVQSHFIHLLGRNKIDIVLCKSAERHCTQSCNYK
jgi:hypothetical protein